ncbi:olfactory receptor 6C74 [Xenopus laevis]|nr:olfactory receptor 6C74 [Xenopus laevis]
MVNYFIIKGISDLPELQLLIFLLVLLLYLIILGGNLSILLLVCLDSQLKTPMYFFLGNLSILDVSSATVTLHKIFFSYITGDKTVSFIGCMAQVYVFASFTSQELLLLTAMSYDRYVAICKPLHYHIVMTPRVCIILALFCWVWGFLQVLPPVYILANFSCYLSNVLNHFFCDFASLMKLSCSDTGVLVLLNLTEGLLVSTLTPFILTFISYVFIIISILKIQTSAGRHKAFYTCSSHLTVVVLLYIILTCQYLVPNSKSTVDLNKHYSLFNTMAIPMMNPLIYSLKNKDVKSAIQRRLRLWRLNA